MDPVFFSSQKEWHDWLKKNHDKKTEVWIGFYKSKSGIKGITNKEAVDEALCYGWIDGLVKGIDEHTWMKRFTPRKPKSIWSKINIKRVEELITLKKMQPAGLKAFELKNDKRSGIYSFENETKEFTGDYLEKFTSNSTAWQNFLAMPPSYRKTSTHLVLSAKQESTRRKRLEELIHDSENNRRIKPLRRPGIDK
jgi:uncharacterized protein YdeI (YjbR/CyaY-like superfamily)